MEYSSKLIQEAVEEISKLPGIGKKTALRLVLHLLKQPESQSEVLSEAIRKLRMEIQYCAQCKNISDDKICRICSSQRRDRSVICLVEDTRDVMAIENTSQFNGLYHVLGGVISPIDGIGPGDLNIDALIQRIENADNQVKEVILALSPTMEGDTT
ncbi:MAG: recombination mediator RecR, partial [Cyclobacteriaceae bacterium]